MAANPDPIDVHVGARVRLRRTLLGMSQEKLGEALRLTFQQIQKYERGANRIGSSRLFRISRILDVPISYFFEEMDIAAVMGGRAGMAEPSAETYEPDTMAKRETLELVRAYYRIEDEKLRRRVLELVRAIANRQTEIPI